MDESDSDSEEKLSYEQLEHAAFKFAEKLKTISIVIDERDHTNEILNTEIDRLKSSIPNDDDCKSCEVLFSEINTLRDVNSINCKKLEYEIEKSKNLKSSFALGFALHAHVIDELVSTKNVLTKYKVALSASSLFNVLCAKRAKQNKDFFISQSCSNCFLNEMKLKYALGCVEHIENIVKTNEVLSCPKCRKSKGIMVDCENCANLKNEVSYLKSSLQRFSDGKKQLDMILDQSKVTSYNRGVGFDVRDYFTKNQPNVLSITECREILTKPSAKKTIFKSGGILPSLFATLKETKINISKPSTSQTCREKYICTFC